MKKVQVPALALAALCISTCMSASATAASTPQPDRIAGVRNIEDLAPIPGSEWVIGSSMAGGTATAGKLVAINAKSGEALSLYPAPNRANAKPNSGCPGQVAADAFKPHGIFLRPTTDGHTAQLYVVNHGGRESVEIFDILSGATPGLRWTGCAMLPPGAFGNGVASSPDGGFFVTNMGKTLDGRDPITAMGGDIIAWTQANGWRTIADSAIPAPNGLIATQDGRTLYVASWTGSTITELKLGEKTERRTVAVDFLPDNLRWSRNGTILVAGQATSVPDVIACYTSTRDACDIPSAVAEVDPASFTVRCSLPVALDMATVAADLGEDIWVGTTRGDAVLRLPAATLHACAPS
nr:G18 [uncultured bacterium]